MLIVLNVQQGLGGPRHGTDKTKRSTDGGSNNTSIDRRESTSLLLSVEELIALIGAINTPRLVKL
jgi:hypothetical protein